MPQYLVPMKVVVTETFRVTADSEREAMQLALDDSDADRCVSVEQTEGDPEVYHPDIVELP